MTNSLRGKVGDIIRNADRYHGAYYIAETFRGPSLYFHQQALATRRSADFVRHLEYLYATLASWGMHRMGSGGSKMQPFDTFRRSAEPLRKAIATCQTFIPQDMEHEKWALLRDVFRSLKVMASGTSIVGNSKVMHHWMPNIIPPIDREYTFRFLLGHKNIVNNVEAEWDIMRGMISDFFTPVACDPGFGAMCEKWMEDMERHPWDTSTMKVVDNLIIGALKVGPGTGEASERVS
jgi:hypothetical protein